MVEQDQDSVIKINMASEPIYTTKRTWHASLLTPNLSLSLAFFVFLCPTLALSLFLYVISVAQVVNGAESH